MLSSQPRCSRDADPALGKRKINLREHSNRFWVPQTRKPVHTAHENAESLCFVVLEDVPGFDTVRETKGAMFSTLLLPSRHAPEV